jgi:uncharacterized SAM-binding protein YcdF (DUF218 family)
MDLVFLLKKTLSAILLPPLLPLLLIGAGLLLLHWRRRFGLTLAWGGFLLALLFSTSAGVRLIATPLENIPALQAQDIGRGQAIVILGGGQRRHLAEFAGAAPNHLSLERLRYGARLARQSGLPVLVSGGTGIGYASPEAAVMAASLKADFAVEARWLEERSRDTQENARFSAGMLKGAGIGRIVLVTHAAHMRRAQNEFAAQGIEVIGAPTASLLDGPDFDWPEDLLPGPRAAYAGWYALHEWLGLAAQSLRLQLARALK